MEIYKIQFLKETFVYQNASIEINWRPTYFHRKQLKMFPQNTISYQQFSIEHSWAAKMFQQKAICDMKYSMEDILDKI